MRTRKEIDGYNYRFVLCNDCEEGIASCVEPYELIERRAEDKGWNVVNKQIHYCPDCKD